jgi:peptide/nickel transport system permease protein
MESNKELINEIDHGLIEEESRFAYAWRIFKKNRMALFGLYIFFAFFIVAISGLVLTYGSDPVLDPAKVRLSEKLLPPFTQVNEDMVHAEDRPFMGIYLLGTDNLGRDVFARMLQGAFVSLSVGFVAVGISVLIGIVLGSISGFYGNQKIKFPYVLFLVAVILSGIFLVSGEKDFAVKSFFLALFLALLSGVYNFSVRRNIMSFKLMKPFFFETFTVDTLIMRFTDVMLCFPSFFLILTVIAVLPPSMMNIMIVIGLTSWMGTGRFVRAAFLSLREQDFVAAARAMGISDIRIIFRHMVPNAMAPVLVSAMFGIAGAITFEAALSYLGLGVPPPHATWGNIYSDGQKYLFDAPWLTVTPGITIMVVVLSFYLFAEGLRDAMNPKLRKR